MISVGLDLGNTFTKICINGKVAKIPSRYAFECPPGQVSPTTGQELKAKAFKLVFPTTGQELKPKTFKTLWFGLDVLGIGAIHKLDSSKYDAEHISILFRAALYQWGRQYKTDLSSLGKLNVVASMPPGLFEKPDLNKKAKAAYQKAFNRGQSHAKVSDGKDSIQIVTQFGSLQQEAVGWTKSFPRKKGKDETYKIVLTVDLGGGTTDYVLFNGDSDPALIITDSTGLLQAYSQIDRINPARVELKVLRDKETVPPQLIIYFNEVERRIQLLKGLWPRQIDQLYLIGGGAALMPKSIRPTFSVLAPEVFVKNEYANAQANWQAAGGE